MLFCNVHRHVTSQLCSPIFSADFSPATNHLHRPFYDSDVFSPFPAMVMAKLKMQWGRNQTTTTLSSSRRNNVFHHFRRSKHLDLRHHPIVEVKHSYLLHHTNFDVKTQPTVVTSHCLLQRHLDLPKWFWWWCFRGDNNDIKNRDGGERGWLIMNWHHSSWNLVITIAFVCYRNRVM